MYLVPPAARLKWCHPQLKDVGLRQQTLEKPLFTSPEQLNKQSMSASGGFTEPQARYSFKPRNVSSSQCVPYLQTLLYNNYEKELKEYYGKPKGRSAWTLLGRFDPGNE